MVNQLDLQIPRGVVFGLLGRNGAGKTTTLRMLLGLVEPTRGGATILDQDCRKLTPETRARIGYLPEGHHVYGWMTVKECGRFQSAFYHKWNEDLFFAVVKHFRLDEKTAAGGLSRGQRAGLCLALTLAPEPELLVLDDPALGLDPVARRSLLESMIYVTRGGGRSILFSSHLLSDVERVADRIAVMDRGVLKAECTVDEFRSRVRQFVLKFPGEPPPLPDLPGLLHSFRTEGRSRRHLPMRTASRKTSGASRPTWRKRRSGWRTPSSAMWANAARNRSFWKTRRLENESDILEGIAGEFEMGGDCIRRVLAGAGAGVVGCG